MPDMKKDLEEIQAFLASPSPLGRFARQDMPEYLTLKAEVENTGRILAKAQYVASMRSIEHTLATYKMKCFVDGEKLDNKKVEAIEEQISNFITELKEGKWS